MIKKVQTDIVIVGGGVAGLWLLNRLRQLGFSTILFESNVLGGGQTSKAQGIIHGGTKYALQGAFTDAAQAISEMPAVWKKCLEGTGEINLTNVPVLSAYQYLFSTSKFTGKLAGFLASFVLKGNVKSLEKKDFPEVFQHSKFQGLVYALNEVAIDVHALIRELAKPFYDFIFKIEPLKENDLEMDDAGRLTKLEVQNVLGETIEVQAQKYIFTAGIGNEMLVQKFKNKKIRTQRRPLHMVIMKTEYSYPVFAHCLGLTATPRITITTHKAKDGKFVWYLGGQLAEEGINRNSKTQIEFAKKECEDLFPWLDFSNATFASFLVDRAEPLQSGGMRPDTAMFEEIENVIAAWPTKLALAPKLAEGICNSLVHANIKSSFAGASALKNFPHPVCAIPIWDEML